MARVGRKTNPVRSRPLTVALSEDVVAFLDALASLGGGYGKSRTEAASLIIRDEMIRLLKSGELETLEKAMKKVRALAAKSIPPSVG